MEAPDPCRPAAPLFALAKIALPVRGLRQPGASVRIRLHSGTAELAVLGQSRTACFERGVVILGAVTGWCRPWFEITHADGSTL
jgi:hypothetical protein